jgi:hypothetical protein
MSLIKNVIKDVVVKPGMRVAFDSIRGLVYCKIIDGRIDPDCPNRKDLLLTLEATEDFPAYPKGLRFEANASRVVPVENIRHAEYSTYIIVPKWSLPNQQPQGVYHYSIPAEHTF